MHDVGPVGTRVPMDLSVIGPVRTGMRIPLSPRCERLGRPRGKDSRGLLSTRNPLRRPTKRLSSGETPSSSGKSTPAPPEALLAS